MLAASLLFVACEKEGPAGPQGPAGPAGPQGPVGSPNVVYSNWLDVTFAGGTDTTYWEAQIPAPRLVDSILARGDVKVFVNLGTAASPQVFPLPLDAFVFQLILTPYFEVGKINLLSTENVSTQTTTGGQKTLQYRYILIPGGVSAGGRTMNINWNNYAEVKAYLGLKD